MAGTVRAKHGAFRPAWWLPGANAQTLWAAVARRTPGPALHWERLRLPDGDFIDLSWAGPDSHAIVVILHGLEGSSDSRYAAGILNALSERGWRAVLLHFRGCSGELNELPRSYHSGETGDLGFLLQVLRERHPECALAAVGYSLGGNVLLKYLGEQGSASPLCGAAAVSVPYDLNIAAKRLNQGFSRLYQWRLLRSLRAKTAQKIAAITAMPAVPRLHELHDFWNFDDVVTAPLHGFDSADDYYARCSSRQFLHRIETPTLLLHARDDPFMSPGAVPSGAELAANVTLELSPRGGHVGFVAGRWPWQAQYWLEQRIPDYFAEYLDVPVKSGVAP